MAKLIFRYGAMGASKTANLLTVRFSNESYVSLCREHFKTGDLGPLFR